MTAVAACGEPTSAPSGAPVPHHVEPLHTWRLGDGAVIRIRTRVCPTKELALSNSPCRNVDAEFETHVSNVSNGAVAVDIGMSTEKLWLRATDLHTDFTESGDQMVGARDIDFFTDEDAGRRVTSAQIGHSWPYTVDNVVVRCSRPSFDGIGAVSVVDPEGNQYALNPLARGILSIPDAAAIRRPDQFHPGEYVSDERIFEVAESVCEAAVKKAVHELASPLTQ